MKTKSKWYSRLVTGIRFCAGSSAVYLLVAVLHACSGSAPKPLAGGAGGSGGAGVSAGVGGASGTSKGGSGGSTGSLTDPVPEANAEESGSRLKAQRYVGEDGTKQFAGWWDSLRQESCTFIKLKDGMVHCAPVLGSKGSVYVGTISYYSDPTCSNPALVYAVNTCEPSPKVAIVTPPGDQCTGYYDHYEVGGSTTSLYSKQPITGSWGSTTIPMGYVAATLGSKIPPSAFVAATTVTDP
mgnify:CR=1 FL=1